MLGRRVWVWWQKVKGVFCKPEGALRRAAIVRAEY